MLVHRRVTPSINFAGTHLYTGWGEALWECLAHEHNEVSPARSRTRTTRSGVERTNHEATEPPYLATAPPMLITADHSAGFDSSCPLMERAIKNTIKVLSSDSAFLAVWLTDWISVTNHCTCVWFYMENECGVLELGKQAIDKQHKQRPSPRLREVQ